MENTHNNLEIDIKLQIDFPKSSEDQKLQLVAINGSIFAIVHTPLESLGPVHLNCEDWSLIILAPIKSAKNILISAINVICLNEIASEEGTVNIHASNLLVKFTNLITPPEKACMIGEQGQFQFDHDPGALLYYYRLFESITGSVRSEIPESFIAAQQQFITALCTLADKIQGKPENLNIHQVLKLWDVQTAQ